MNKVLVTTDLSVNSKSAIKFAVQFAKQAKSTLIFYLVSEVIKPTAWSDKHYKRHVKETTDRYLPKLKEFVEKVAGKKLNNAEYLVELGWDVPKMIMGAAKREKVSFICMSTHGAGKVKKLFGTNSSAIITSSATPVIVIPQKYKVNPIKNILFACDFAALSREMKLVKNMAESIKAKVNVLHYDYLLDVPEKRRKLETRAEKFRSSAINFHFKKLHIENSLSEHLSHEIKKEKPAIVVLFTKQDRNWFDRLILPSQAAEMSFHLKVPLLTFRKK